ncbi:cytochrome P450 2D9-like [Oppia nitens]|uniref:cytochrome P450 2D9-like n=1 Tax=Oppia nitens TaxID=1686743 RepID=UPI0023DA7CD5|nr:cytochrome P450 2D9-like [Oppia nitens]
MGANSKTFVNWSKKYGPVIGIQMGSSPTVLLNDWPTIKDGLSQDTNLDRPVDNIFSSIGPKGLSSMNGQEYREQKRFFLYYFKTKRSGKTSLEDLIVNEINRLCDIIDTTTTGGCETKIRSLFGISLFNIVSRFVFDKQFDYTEKMMKLIDQLVCANPTLALNTVFAQFPIINRFLVKYFKFLLPESANGRAMDEIILLIKNEIKSHEKTVDTSNAPKDYIDAFISESRKHNNSNKSSFNYNNLLGVSFDLYGGLVLSVLSAIEWSIVLLATYPDVQQRIYGEIVSIIGTTDRPVYSQRKHMPYVQAFMYEVLRFRSVTPLNLTRISTADSIIGGHFIPKGTHILANFWSIQNDPKLWAEPNRFRPERFLIDGETNFAKPEHFNPFSIGKRSCPGEVSALIEMFLYIVLLVQKYEIKSTKNTDTTLDYVFQLSVAPKREPVVCFVKRF